MGLSAMEVTQLVQVYFQDNLTKLIINLALKQEIVLIHLNLILVLVILIYNHILIKSNKSL